MHVAPESPPPRRPMSLEPTLNLLLVNLPGHLKLLQEVAVVAAVDHAAIIDQISEQAKSMRLSTVARVTTMISLVMIRV